MIRGLYVSALGMTTQMNKMDVVSNNIANVDTAGYKKDTVVTRSFSEELLSRLDDPGDLPHSKRMGKITPGLFVDDIHTNFKTGALRITNAPLDVAILGGGFFSVAVADAQGNTTEKYTRQGSFTLGPDGTLSTKDGHAVLGEQGPIIVPNGNITIDDTGGLYVDGELIDKLKMVDFEDTHTLKKVGDSLFEAPAPSQVTAFTGKVSSGALENSNVNSVKEMVDLITVARTYEANQRMIGILDNIYGKAVNEVGRK